MGIHILEVDRLARALERRGKRLERKLFSEGELADCRLRRDRVTALAARCAAKGACLRALGTVWSAALTAGQIETRRETGGRPRLVLSGRAAGLAAERGVTRSRVSLSHDAGLALAVVILER